MNLLDRWYQKSHISYAIGWIVAYVLLSYWQPSNLFVVCGSVLAEQLAYGVGFSAYLAYLSLIPNREQGKSLMALSLMAGCLLSAFLYKPLGYNAIFVLTLSLGGLTLLSPLLIRNIPINK